MILILIIGVVIIILAYGTFNNFTIPKINNAQGDKYSIFDAFTPFAFTYQNETHILCILGREYASYDENGKALGYYLSVKLEFCHYDYDKEFDYDDYANTKLKPYYIINFRLNDELYEDSKCYDKDYKNLYAITKDFDKEESNSAN